MEKDLQNRLIFLANKYETAEFLKKDPSQFMHRFSSPLEQETVAFVAANLSFGRREQIIAHIESILADCEKHKLLPTEWILQEKYKDFFLPKENFFYRIYSNNSMILFFDGINFMLKKSGSIQNHIKAQLQKENLVLNKEIFASQVIAQNFRPECNLVPHTKESASKKINMFLRWMVRKNSPVDLGLWSSWFSAKNLLMPLDTHVMQQSVKLGLIPLSSGVKFPSANLKTAVALTQKLKEVFPEDPVRADFALFGYGVEFD